MPHYTCSCGARYRLPDHAVGKKAKCRKCGVVFTIPPEEIPVAEPVEEDGGYVIAVAPEPAAPVARAFVPVPLVEETQADFTPEQLVALGRAAGAEANPQRGFWSDVAWAFLLFTDLNNLIMIMIIWFLYAIKPLVQLAPIIGFWANLIILGWLCSYWFKVIQESAGGEDQLPTLSLSEGWLDDIIFPLLKYLGAGLLAWTPAIVCATAVALHVGSTFLDIIAKPTPVLYTFIAVSAFLWPMLLLVIAVGGFSSVWRVDLIVQTIVRTFLPYLAVCLLFAGTRVLEFKGEELAIRVTGGFLKNIWLSTVLTALVKAYAGIVGMWIVGLYYHHFKSRFAWSWG